MCCITIICFIVQFFTDIDMKTKPVMCSFKTAFSNSSLCYVGIESFPCECDIILFEDFSIDNKSVITVETGKYDIMLYFMSYIRYSSAPTTRCVKCAMHTCLQMEGPQKLILNYKLPNFVFDFSNINIIIGCNIDNITSF